MADKTSPKKQKTETQFNSKKIIIETKTDLYNLPINLLKSSKILDFSGKYFDFIYNRALDLEKIKSQRNSINSNVSTKTKKSNLAQKENMHRNATYSRWYSPKKKLSKKTNVKSEKKIHKNKTSTKLNSNKNSKQNKNTFQESNNISKFNINNKSNNEDNIPLQNLNQKSNNNNNQNINFNINIKNNYYKDDYMDYYNDNLTDINNTMPYQKNNFQNNLTQNINEFKINKICFEMRYNTRIGENLGIIGSIPELGLSWKENKALKMKLCCFRYFWI